MTNLTFDVALALYQSQETEQFPIDFDDAWQWLEYSRKDHAKGFLTANFAETLDFTVLPPSPGKLGRPSEEIRLTVTCLKEWGMMAGTAKGKEIRRYFIECERIVKERIAVAPIDPLAAITDLMVRKAAEICMASKAVNVAPESRLAVFNCIKPIAETKQPKPDRPSLPTAEKQSKPVQDVDHAAIVDQFKREALQLVSAGTLGSNSVKSITDREGVSWTAIHLPSALKHMPEWNATKLRRSAYHAGYVSSTQKFNGLPLKCILIK
jgi:phage anti-repressor protein